MARRLQSAASLKAQKKASKHDLGRFAHVVPILELAKILGKVLARNMNMGAANAALQLRPEALNGVDVSRATYPFVGAVVDRLMVIAKLLENAVRPPLVSADAGSGPEPFDDRRNEGLASSGRDNLGEHLAVALKDTHNHGLSLGATPREAFDLGLPAPDVGFVNLDVASKRRIAVNLSHVLADFVAHAPGRLVGHAQLALQFLRRYAMPQRGEQVHRVEPLLKRRARVLERRPHHWVKVVPAIASVGGHFSETMKRANLSALWAARLVSEPEPKQVLKARIVIGKPVEKILNVEHGSHRYPSYTYNIGIAAAYVKGIIASGHCALMSGNTAK